MKLFSKAQRRIYMMKDSGKGTILVPDYRHIYTLFPDIPVEVPDEIARIILDQNPGVVSKTPFVKLDKAPEPSIKYGTGISGYSLKSGHPSMSGWSGYSGPFDNSNSPGLSGHVGPDGFSGDGDKQEGTKLVEKVGSKPKKEPIPEPEIPKGKPIGTSPIPD